LVPLSLPFGSMVRADAPTIASADAAFASGKFDQARKNYASLVKADPKAIAPYPGLVQSLLRLDRWREALSVAQTAVTLDPNSADARGLLALAEIRAGEPEAAGMDASLALAQDKDNYWGLVAAARIADWNGHDKDSNSLFAQATALHPERPDAWLGLIQTQNGSSITESDLAVANHYLALRPKGQPFDFKTPYIQNMVSNETSYWRSFDADPPFHLDKADEKQPSFTTVFPIQRDGNSVLITVQIDGKPFHLLFDTGADELLLSKKAARRLRLADMAKTYISGVQGKASAALQRADTLTLGSVTMNSIPITVSDAVPDENDGIFGGTLLENYAVTLDFGSSTMTIAHGPGAGYIALPHTMTATAPLHLFDGHLFVSTHAQKQRIWAILDTGAYTDVFGLALTQELSKTIKRDLWKEGSYDQRVGIGDSSMRVDACNTPQEVTFAFDGSTPPAVLIQDGLIGRSFLDHQISPSMDFEVGMMLGIPLLSQHSRVTIDYPHRLLTFEDPLP
jgi:predicted aspartyl protease